jgi:hypothetical protein
MDEGTGDIHDEFGYEWLDLKQAGMKDNSMAPGVRRAHPTAPSRVDDRGPEACPAGGRGLS